MEGSYTYKGNTYQVIGVTFMKDPVSRSWMEAVVYSPVVDGKMSATLYTRELGDFVEKFIKI